jgi:GNAT superfamily N-acetyltransferase
MDPMGAERIPRQVSRRLIPDNADEPLIALIRRKFSRGRPGVTHEYGPWWVVRDQHGRVVGGVRVGEVGVDHPPALDVAVDEHHRRLGYATALYEALSSSGIDVEAASAASLAHRSMTLAGYMFMVGRRSKIDLDAGMKIAATADVCPSCGVCD